MEKVLGTLEDAVNVPESHWGRMLTPILILCILLFVILPLAVVSH
jgi:hypothetical protein